MKDLDERLKKVSQKHNEKRLIETHLSGISNRLHDQQNELAALSIELDRLDNLLQADQDNDDGITKLFKKFSGQLSSNMNVKGKPFLLTYLKHKDLLARLETKEYEISVLENKLSAFTGVEDLYNKLLKEKTQQLKYRYKDLSTELILLETAIRKQDYQQTQIFQAEEVGKELIQLLKDLYDGLVEITTLDHPYHSEIRNNQVVVLINIKKRKQAKSLQQTLQIISKTCETFIDELHDVSVRFKLDYKPFVPQISKFLEYFYDGYISDWIRASKLKISLNHIDMTLAKVNRIMSMLENDLAIAQKKQVELKSKLETIVLKNKI